MTAMILLAYTTGLRVGNIMALRWRDLDLSRGTVTVQQTKNGAPIVAVLARQTILELKKLTNQHADAYVFEGKGGQPFHWRRLWIRVCQEAGLPGKNFHQLRHGCAYRLATNGVSQAQIMAIMGHKTLTASARYMHHNTTDKKAIIAQVFEGG